MKLKNLFFGSLACLAFAACSNDDDVVVNPSAENEGNAYVAVQFVMPGGSATRANGWNDATDDIPTYIKGDADEVAVADATFFFYDANGNEVQEPQTYTFESWIDGSVNTIDKISNVIIVIKDKVPSQIAAVLNMPANAKDEDFSTLTKLTTALSSIASGNEYAWNGHTSKAFVMSNSVYKDAAGKILYATPVKDENVIRKQNISDAEDEAKNHPVVIPVERVLARVSVSFDVDADKNLTGGYSDNQLDLYNDDYDTKVEIKPFISGWWLHSTNKDSYVIKQLKNADYTWDDGSALEVGWWNDVTDKRSYWANAYNVSGGYNTYRYSSAAVNDRYCFENTDATNATTLMVAAILKTFDGVKWNPVNLIQWLSYNFISDDDCLTFLASYLNTNQYSNAGNPLTKDNLKFIYNNDDHLSLNDQDWQTRIGVQSGVDLQKNGSPIANAETELLNAIGYLKYYKNGQTYYFTKIQHASEIDETKYAVIRNHKYVVNIQGITGLGTPVPNPEDGTPDNPTDPTPTPGGNPDYPENPDPTDPTDPDQPLDPETPTNDHSAIAARIQILKYRVVSQDVTLDNK